MNPFTEEYYENGIEAGVSNYEDYRFLPDAMVSWAAHLRKYLGIQEGDSVLDVGAAKGHYCQGLRMLGIKAFGFDVSEYAVKNCHHDMRPFMSNHLNGSDYDFIYSKDCFEHVPEDDLKLMVRHLLTHCRKKMLVIVPLAVTRGGKYIHPKEEKDTTHINRWTLPNWLRFFQECTASFVVNGSYCYPGLKPGCYEVECGYGFFMMERI